MTDRQILEAIRGRLIVSCQALEDEPLHSGYIMSRMAYAAFLGGAGGIRANSVEDIREIKKTVSLPIIGIIKKDYAGYEVRITPTMHEVDALVQEGVDIIAMDATLRVRAGGNTVEDLFPIIREKYPDQLFMADCSCFEDAKRAERLGFDLVGTTLNGYTAETRQTPPPNFELMEKMAKEIEKPVIAEGGIFSPQELRKAMDTGVWACVVGSAITRPMEITKRYVAVLE